jgi:SAM-dependent methyltransferase
MSSMDTTSAAFFEAKYSDAVDPWNFEADAYEQFRYQAILKALSPYRYQYAWEPGCSIGVLTAKLASICDRVDACDISETAVRRARIRCSEFPAVQLRCAAVTEDAPIGDYDLIVLSEIGYYFSLSEWQFQVERIANSMRHGATLLAAHWLGYSPDHILSGDAVHQALSRNMYLGHEHEERHPQAGGGFRIDRWRRT